MSRSFAKAADLYCCYLSGEIFVSSHELHTLSLGYVENWIHLLNNIYVSVISSGYRLAHSRKIINFDFNLYDNTLTQRSDISTSTNMQPTKTSKVWAQLDFFAYQPRIFSNFRQCVCSTTSFFFLLPIYTTNKKKFPSTFQSVHCVLQTTMGSIMNEN
jgi:hypothetical protein